MISFVLRRLLLGCVPGDALFTLEVDVLVVALCSARKHRVLEPLGEVVSLVYIPSPLKETSVFLRIWYTYIHIVSTIDWPLLFVHVGQHYQ